MVELFDEGYHHTPRGQLFLEYLAEPSTVLYGVFKELIAEGLATSVYHKNGKIF